MVVRSILLAGALAPALLAATLVGAGPQSAPPGSGAASEPEGGPTGTAEPTAAEKVFVESLEITLVNVDVYVTDGQGRRVTDLKREDFELFEDGQPVEVTHFVAVDGDLRKPVGRATEGAPAVAASPPGTGREAGVPTPPRAIPAGPEERRRHLVVFVDNVHLHPLSRNRALDHLRRFLHREVTAEDRVMLVSFDRSLRVRLPFTRDLATVDGELDALAADSGLAAQRETERRDTVRRIRSSRSFFEAESHADFFAKAVYDDASRSVEALKELVGSLAGLSGRKALIYVSDGLPMTAGEDLFNLVDQTFQGGTTGQLRSARYRGRNSLRELTARANANRVTFYPLEAAGTRAHASLSAEFGGHDSSLLEADTLHGLNLRQPLELMAADTGGLAATNTNNLTGALERLGEDLDSYYSLAYRPTHAVRGRYHTIEVKVKRPGVEVRHRAGYRDKTAETRITESTLAALLHGVESNGLAVELVVEGAVQRQEDGTYRVPLAVRIPLAQVTLVPQGEQHVGRLRVALAAADAEGGVSSVRQTPVPLAIPAADLATARQQFYVYAAELLMRPGRQQVAVGVRDEVSGATSFIARPLHLGS